MLSFEANNDGYCGALLKELAARERMRLGVFEFSHGGTQTRTQEGGRREKQQADAEPLGARMFRVHFLFGS